MASYEHHAKLARDFLADADAPAEWAVARAQVHALLAVAAAIDAAATPAKPAPAPAKKA